MPVLFPKVCTEKKTTNLGVCLPNWEWCCDPLVTFIPPKSGLLTQGADDLIFSLELNLDRKESSEDDAAEWVEIRQLTCGRASALVC